MKHFKTFLHSFSALINYLIIVILTLCTAACIQSYPLGMNELEWNRLTPQQQMEAREKQAALNLERQKLQLEQEREEAHQAAVREQQQYDRDVAHGMIYSYSPKDATCIGGEKCYNGLGNDLVLSLGRKAAIDTIVVCADDDVGHKHEGRLSIQADHELVADNQELSIDPTCKQYYVGRNARNILIRAHNNDEARIHKVKVFGSWRTWGDEQIIIIRN